MENNKHEVWVVAPGVKSVLPNLTAADALAVYTETVRQLRAEGWTLIDTYRIPANLSKLVKAGQLVCIGIVDTDVDVPTQPIPRWLVRVPTEATKS